MLDETRIGEIAALLALVMRESAASNLELQMRFADQMSGDHEPLPENYARLVNEETFELFIEIAYANPQNIAHEFVDVLVTLAGLYEKLERWHGDSFADDLRGAVVGVVAKNSAKTPETHQWNGRKIVKKMVAP
jgi:NTP pyrophosphatase (non-canonical NTP hydrolase)